MLTVKRLIELLLDCGDSVLDAEIVFTESEAETFNWCQSYVIGFVQYCVRDNLIYLHEDEPNFDKNDKREDIETTILKEGENFAETVYREK